MRSSALHTARTLPRRQYSSIASPPIVRIKDGTFYRHQPPVPGAESSELNNPPLFQNLDFSLSSDGSAQEHANWAIIGPSNAGKTTFLELLRGQHLCVPPTARSYPYLSTDTIAGKDPRLRYSGNAIQYVGFDNSRSRGLSGMGTYMSARYESRREATDFSVKDYLLGRTQLNPLEEEHDEQINFDAALQKVVVDLRLQQLLSMPLSNLSNGQTRRARIAKALLGRPEVLLLDEPFMGLDPPTTLALADLLGGMAAKHDPRVLLALRPQDKIPDWITHILFLGEDLRITTSGPKEAVVREVVKIANPDTSKPYGRSYTEFAKSLVEQGLWRESGPKTRNPTRTRTQLKQPKTGEAVIEMNGVIVKYGDKTVLGKGRQIDALGQENDKDGLWWTVRKGQRWGVFGPNGSGKTTIISLITSDHPQSYSLPIKLFQRSRLPSPGKPGIPLFELQRRIGHSSPELHSFYPRHLTVRAALESAFADTPVSRPTTLTVEADERISAFLRWFQGELNPTLGDNKILAAEVIRPFRELRPHTVPGDPNKWREARDQYWFEYKEEREREVEWADKMTFGELSFSAQRVLLFLRALVAQPDIVVLDESFSGLDERVREKCLLFLEKGETWIMRLVPRGPMSTQVKDRAEEAEELVQKAYEAPVPTARTKWETHDACFFGLTDEQALIVVSHVKEEIPGSVRDWIFLPDASTGDPIKIGHHDGRPLRLDTDMWDRIWGLDRRSFAHDAAKPEQKPQPI